MQPNRHREFLRHFLFTYLEPLLTHVTSKIQLHLPLWLRNNARIVLETNKDPLATLHVVEVGNRIAIYRFATDVFAVLRGADRLAVDVAGPRFSQFPRDPDPDGLDDVVV